MKNKIYILAIILFSSLSLRSQAPAWQWAKGVGGSNEVICYAIKVDASGNSYLTGCFNGETADFGSITLTNVHSTINYQEIFIVKYDPSGKVLWAKSAGGDKDDMGKSITVDANGNSYITGDFYSSSITFDSITLTKGGSTGTGDIFIAKYDPSGNVLWVKSAGGADYDFSNSITVDAIGNSYITGYFYSASIVFGGLTLTNAGSSNIFIVKYDSSGAVLSAISGGGTDYDYGTCIALDASGNLFVTGSFTSPVISFGGISLTNSRRGFDNIFVVKYNSSGIVLWAKSAGGTEYDRGNSIAVDAKGNLFLTGTFSSPTINFGSTTLNNTDLTFRTQDVFIVKYDSTGNILWAKGVKGKDADYCKGITVDAAGDAYIAGYFASDTLRFGNATLINVGGFNYPCDVFVVKYDAFGNIIWAKSAGGTQDDYCNGISSDATGNLYLTGSFLSIDFNFGSITIMGTGYWNIFIAKLANTSGIDEENISVNAANIFPNPSNGQINITSSNTIDALEITNPLGQIIYQTIPNKKNISLQLEPDGIYFVTVLIGKQRATKKLIVQH